MNIKKTLLSISVLTLTTFSYGQTTIEAHQATSHIGKSVTACGKLADFKHFRKVHFFNLDHPYPNQTLTIVIFNPEYDDFISHFGGGLEQFMGDRVCASGVITSYDNRLEIKLQNPIDLKIP